MCEPVTATASVMGAAGVAGGVTTTAGLTASMAAAGAANAAAFSAQMLTYASLASSILGGVGQMYGAAQQASAANASARYQAQVARNSQVYAERQAQDALDRGDLTERQHRQQVSQLMGRQRTAQAANGVLVDSGSALNTVEDTAQLGEFDALTIRSNAQREAYGYRAQAAGYSNDAAVAGSRSANGLLAGGSSLLSTAGTVADKWYRFNKAGAI